MADLTYSDLIAKYPEFTSAVADDQTRIATAIDLAESLIATGVLRNAARTTLARLTLAAHFTRVQSRACAHTDNGTGPVLSRTNGARSISYGALPSVLEDADLTSTAYGVSFMRMMRGERHRRPLVAT